MGPTSTAAAVLCPNIHGSSPLGSFCNAFVATVGAIVKVITFLGGFEFFVNYKLLD